MTYTALLVRPQGIVERVELDSASDGQRSIRSLIGDGFSTCFALPGSAPRRTIVGYCDDRYMDKPRDVCPWNVFLDPLSVYQGGWPMAGPIVVAGALAPDTVSLTELEIAAVRIDPRQQYVGTLDGQLVKMPVLTFLPGYDVGRRIT